MDNTPATGRPEIIKDQSIKSYLAREGHSTYVAGRNPLFDKFVSEKCEDFFNYLDWLGLAKNPNLMLLSSMHHFYYDINDLKGVKILVNLKQLNRIKLLDGFFQSIFRLLPSGALFLGCFKDDRDPEGIFAPIYQSMKLFNDIFNFIDSRTEKRMTRDGVLKILKSHGFRIEDMTEINELIYFMAVNTRNYKA